VVDGLVVVCWIRFGCFGGVYCFVNSVAVFVVFLVFLGIVRCLGLV